MYLCATGDPRVDSKRNDGHQHPQQLVQPLGLRLPGLTVFQRNGGRIFPWHEPINRLELSSSSIPAVGSPL